MKPATLLKKRLQHRCFPVKFLKYLSTPFLLNTSRQLLLEISYKFLLYVRRTRKVKLIEDSKGLGYSDTAFHLTWWRDFFLNINSPLETKIIFNYVFDWFYFIHNLSLYCSSIIIRFFVHSFGWYLKTNLLLCFFNRL